MLAALALRRGQVVPVEELVRGVWGSNPPVSATSAVRNHVSRLRAALETDPRTPRLLVSLSGGYSLRSAQLDLDLDEFERLAADASRARMVGDVRTAARLLHAASGLWTGPPLAGVPGGYAERQRELLAERRLTVVQARLAADLDLGLHDDVVAELATLVDAHPAREGLRALEMLALYRCGRPAAALAAYERAKHLCVAPGPEPTAMYQRILRADPALAPAAPTPFIPSPSRPKDPLLGRSRGPRPTQLPPDIRDFTGRADVVAELGRVLTTGAHDHRTAVVVCVLHGMGGVGKTTLAVHVAHTVRDRFPDGQLYVDLRGSSGDPLDPHVVQGRFLVALGVAAEAVPDGTAERTALYRSRLADRRVLVVLDNAHAVEQVEALLPGTARCAVLVTARTAISSLPARRFALDVPAADEALALLEDIVGIGRSRPERRAARELVDVCGRLPLAVRIAAARLTARPRWSVAAFVARLADGPRLTEPRDGFLATDGVFELGYAPLEPAHARVFRLLAVARVAEISSDAAAAALEMDEEWVEEILESLVDAGLMESGEPGRYGYHDLLRRFARERAERIDPPDECDAILARLAAFHLARLGDALRAELPNNRLPDLIDPRGRPGAPFAGADEARQWVGTELAGILAVAEQLVHPDRASVTVADARTVGRVLSALVPFAEAGFLWRTLEALADGLLRLARTFADSVLAVTAHTLLAVTYTRTGCLDAARMHIERALAVPPAMQVTPQYYLMQLLGLVCAAQNLPEEAIAHYTEARAKAHADGNSVEEAMAVLRTAQAHLTTDEPELALHESRVALTMRRMDGNVNDSALPLIVMGRALHTLGRLDEAAARYTEAVDLCALHGLRMHRIQALLGLATTRAAAGHIGAATTSAQAALTLADELGDTAAIDTAHALLDHATAGATGASGAHG
ncbi:AfsR family transcriptional regulator [Streptomyces sp. SID3343]|nr:AfsR family transcriptional regulator [Streptomyces sp. SID3343]